MRTFAIYKDLIDDVQKEQMYDKIIDNVDLFYLDSPSWVDEEGLYFIGEIDYADEEVFINALDDIGIRLEMIAFV